MGLELWIVIIGFIVALAIFAGNNRRNEIEALTERVNALEEDVTELEIENDELREELDDLGEYVVAIDDLQDSIVDALEGEDEEPTFIDFRDADLNEVED